MEFRTVVSVDKNIPAVTHQDSMLLMGSCFAEHIGRLLTDAKFICDTNPFGILYNPLSISGVLNRIISGENYTAEELFYDQGSYHSYMHHGSFSDADSALCLEKINYRLNKTHLLLPQLRFVFFTFGTAWIYSLKNGGGVVSNCHKVAAEAFDRRRLTIEEITSEYNQLIHSILAVNPGIRFVFTVSPVRHAKDGLHENQLSKGTLLLAIHELQTLFPEQVFYFPSYEIVHDELRDYRFYADDMLHPSGVAIQYIWERFGEALFSRETKNIIKECESIRRDINHRPLSPDSDGYQHFLGQLVLKMNRLTEKYPNLDLQNELDICHIRLKK